MATNKHLSLRSLATKVLKSLCGGNRKKYHYVRDHFTFCFQMKRLYYFSHNILQSAVFVKEKTRQCSADWKGPAVALSALGVGDLIGTQDLISEDNMTELNLKGCGKALDDMWTIIKNRGGSWRQFCGFRSLPLSQRQSKNSNSNKEQHNIEKELSNVPPIKVLFWIASSLTGTNQVKVLRMIDFALTDWKGWKASLKISTNSADEGSSHDKDSEDDLVIGIGSAFSKPEELLLKSGNRKLVVDDIIAFSLHVVHSGKTSELRRVAYQIVSKLSQVISSEERLSLFQNLIASIEDVGLLGKAGVEFLNLLQALSQSLKPSETVGQIADFVVDSFMQQLDAIKYDRSNGEWTVLESNVSNSVMKKKFDLSGCLFCLKPQHYSWAKEPANKSSERRHLSNSGRVPSRSGSNVVAGRINPITTRQKWRYEQISPFSRCRLESLKESCISNEFNLFYKLKYRISISEIHLTVSDPRGRYVKTVSVFFTSRPLSGSLKSDDYTPKWQKIATLNLARGGSRASVSLSKPIIAANIRIEFTDFYERPGDKDKGAGGSLVLHCPRCTRPVTNAHGVCVTCGEVAFQCRKCRHINYDRLDAFLCVECGYTCCGSFSFELNSAIVSNAIAITDDSVFDKSVEMYGTVCTIQERLKEKLGEKLRSLKRKKENSEVETGSFYDPVVERAFLGLLPAEENEDRKESQELRMLDRLDKQGSVVKYVAHPDSFGGNARSDSATDRSERARSLLRLARQIRSESSSSSDRRRSTDIIIRHLGRVSLQNLESENELLEILESGNSGTNEGEDDDKDSGDKDQKEKEKSQKIEVEECQKMLVLLREAWRESDEIRRRIDAWKCLNSGALVKSTPLERTTEKFSSFSPSHCSLCGGSVALHFLVLWLKLYLVAPAQVCVDEGFFGILFQDDVRSHSKGLQDIKKQAIISIATNSRHGAEMVLRELEKRLKASHDMYCAGILGNIMEIEGFNMINEYEELAIDILSSRTDTAFGT
jgi:E3 ubiquitin-protein ligase UBR4